MLTQCKQELAVWKSSIAFFILNRIITYFPSRHIRMGCLKVMGVTLSGKVSLFGGFEIRNPRGLVFEGDCSVGPNVMLDARRGLVIGKNVTIAREAMIWTLHHDYNDMHFRGVGEPVRIGDYAWLCSRSIILPGVTIGEYAVVASGAVVTKNVEPYAVVGGVPAKKIGERSRIRYSYSPFYPQHLV